MGKSLLYSKIYGEFQLRFRISYRITKSIVVNRRNVYFATSVKDEEGKLRDEFFFFPRHTPVVSAQPHRNARVLRAA